MLWFTKTSGNKSIHNFWRAHTLLYHKNPLFLYPLQKICYKYFLTRLQLYKYNWRRRKQKYSFLKCKTFVFKMAKAPPGACDYLFGFIL
jgi:hypothetical protein